MLLLSVAVYQFMRYNRSVFEKEMGDIMAKAKKNEVDNVAISIAELGYLCKSFAEELVRVHGVKSKDLALEFSNSDILRQLVEGIDGDTRPPMAFLWERTPATLSILTHKRETGFPLALVVQKEVLKLLPE